MKTKIMLSFTVILAVTFIGMARPSHSDINSDLNTSEESLHFSEAQVSSQEKNDAEKQEQDKSEEKESKEKKSQEKNIESITLDGKTGHIDIIIVEGDQTKKIRLEEKPVIILEKDGSVDKLSLNSEGKCWTIKKGEKGFLVIEGDKVDLIQGKDKFVKLKKGKTIRVKTEEKEGGRKVITIEGPHIVIHKGHKACKHLTIHIKGEKGDKNKVIVAPYVKVNPVVNIKIKEKILQEQIQKIQDIVRKIVEQRLDHIEALENYEEMIAGIADKKIQERLNKIFVRLSEDLEAKVKIQEETMKALEESLEKLREELEKKEEKPVHVAITHKDDVKKIEGDHIYVHKGQANIIELIDKEKGFTLIFKDKINRQQKEVYTKALEKLKSRLPEGFEVESEFDEDSDTVCITIKGDDKKKESKEKLKELLKELKEELSKAEDDLSPADCAVFRERIVPLRIS